MRPSIIDRPRDIALVPLAGIILAVVAAGLIVRQPFPINVGLVPAIGVAVADLLLPVVSPLLLVASVPMQTVGAFSLGGVGLTATKLALAASLAALLVHLVTRRDGMRGSVILIPYIGYLLAMLLSLSVAQDLNAGFTEIYRWFVTVFALALVLHAVRSRRAVLAFVAVMGLGVLGQVAYGAIQSLLALGPASFAVTSSVFRAYGTFGKPNTYAGYLEMTGPLLLAVAVWSARRAGGSFRHYRAARLTGMRASSRVRREAAQWTALTTLLVLSGVASLVGIVLSFSRGAWLGVAAGILAMLMVSARRLPILRLVVVAVLAAVVAGAGIHYAPAAIQDRYEQLVSQIRLFDSREVMVTPQTFAAVERMAHWQTGLAMFASDPLLGVGVGNFNARFTEFHIHPGFPVSAGHAHNYYIQALAETGLVGLVAYLALMGTALATCIRAARTGTDGLARAVGVGAVGVTVAVMTHNVVEDLHVLNLGVQLAAVWGLAVVGMRLAREREAHALSRPEPSAN